jgi:polysaccharide chain length determinant protein (PEP-CTERM system associated)
MHEVIGEILGYLQGASRYKWTTVVTAWLVCISAWVYISQMPDRYQADARVHVDTRSVLRPLLSGLAIQPDVSGRIRLMAKLMFSRPNLEKVARMTDLDLGVKSDAAMEKLVTRLQSSMSITGGDADLFTIGFQDPDPKVAKKVVQALLTIFVEQTLGESREDSNSAQKFLDQQIKEYETRLQVSEKALEEFKRANYGLLPGAEGGNLYEQMTKLNTQLEDAALAQQEAIDRRDEMKRQLEDEESMSMDMVESAPEEAGVPSALDQRIQTLQTRLDELLLKYTKNHPEVVAVKKSIADLRRQKEREDAEAAQNAAQSAAGSEGGISPEMAENPVFQQMKLQLSEAEANIASLGARVKAYQDKIENLKKQMDNRLKVETELAGLNRDYEAVRTNYNQLLTRRETARMSENVEQNTDSVKFRIVDPPQVPTKPAAPNRILLFTVALFAGIVVGFGLAVFLALLRPSYATTQKLRDVTGLPVLGSVSMNWIPEIRKRKWRQFLIFVAAFAMLLLVFAGVLALEVKGYHLPTFISV